MSGDAVSVVVVSWNARDHLAKCLDRLGAIRASGASPVADVVVVDNASEDGSGELVSTRYPGVRLLASGVNLGFAGGANRGIRGTGEEFVLLLNPDVEPTAEAVASLARALSGRPDAGAAGGLLVDRDGRPQPGGVRRFPTLATWAVDLLLVDKVWPSNPVTMRYLAKDVDASGAVVDVDQPAAACLLVRRSAFEAIGGFDEGFYPAWLEDVDFCRRLREARFRILLVPAAAFVHEGGVAMRRLGPAFERIWYRNVERYVRKHHGPAGALVMKLLIVAGMTLRIGWSVLSGAPARARTYAGVAAQALGAHSRP